MLAQAVDLTAAAGKESTPSRCYLWALKCRKQGHTCLSPSACPMNGQGSKMALSSDLGRGHYSMRITL